MPATQPSMDLRPLCHEHHLEMRLNRSLSNGDGGATQAMAYRCTEPDCVVHYNTSRGYFLSGQNEDKDAKDALPEVRCLKDGVPMYLAKTSRAKTSFRLWTCPQCGAGRTNEDGVIGLSAEEIGDLDRGNAADSEPSPQG